MPVKVKIDFVSDVVCPWCAIGLHSLLRAVKAVQDEVQVELHFQPFELNPDAPPEGQDQAQVLSANYGKSLEEVAAMGRVVARRSRGSAAQISTQSKWLWWLAK